MKILFIGDIIGKPGRRAVSELLPGLISEHEIDLVIAKIAVAVDGVCLWISGVDAVVL